MDPLSDILMLMRPTGYGFRGLDAGGAWALSFSAARGIRCFAVEEGSCLLRLADGTAAIRMDAGDVILASTDSALALCSSEDAQAIDADAFLSGVAPGRTAILNGGGECRGIGGFFAIEGVGMDRIFAALPPVVHVHSRTTRTALYASAQQLLRELSEPRPGSALLASHLAQALIIEALRAHLEEGKTGQGWLSALADPRLNRALNAMHADVARRWTLPAMADVAGMSRASFAAHFERVIGETPIAYLTRWRMVLAADRMATSGMTITDVAASVGYESDSAFGATFKRIMGYTPGRHRQQASAAPA
jgi:AraC-like DNA-binding protein